MKFEPLRKYLDQRSPEILEQWCRAARQPGTPAQRRGVVGEALLDHLPSLLKMLSACLCEEDTPAVLREGEEHGAQRRGLGYTVTEILEEMRLFRKGVIAAVDDFRRGGGPLSEDDLASARLCLIELIDRSATASVARYDKETQGERDNAQTLLEQRNRELVAANQHKDRFLTVLSHELRSPLSAIVAAADIIEHLVPPESNVLKPRAIIARQARHLANLVDELLDVSRIAYGKIEMQMHPLPLQDAVTFAVESCRSTIEAAHLELRQQLPKEPLLVSADSKRLTQVIMNLLTNAQKFTPSGGTIELNLAREEDQAVLRIRDSGIGIDGEMLSRIFELFTQAENSLRRSSTGLGIGLTLAKSLIELQGGTIEARSDGVGQGSEFIVRLPLYKE